MFGSKIIMFIKKLLSRKFLAAMIGAVTGIGLVFGLEGDIITSVSGAVLSGASLITYIITEGRIDAEAVRETAQEIQKAADTITGDNIG